MYKKLITTITIALFLSSCATQSVKVKPMPVEPVYRSFSRAPVVEKQEKNFIVTDEFMLRATQEHEYLKRVHVWKSDNAVP